MVTIFFHWKDVTCGQCIVRYIACTHFVCLALSLIRFRISLFRSWFSVAKWKKMTTTRKKRTAIQTKSKSHNCMSEHEFYLHRFFLHVRPTNEWKKERVEYLFILISLLQRLCSCDDISFMLCEENVGSFFCPSFSRDDETIEQYSKCIHLWTTK